MAVGIETGAEDDVAGQTNVCRVTWGCNGENEFGDLRIEKGHAIRGGENGEGYGGVLGAEVVKH